MHTPEAEDAANFDANLPDAGMDAGLPPDAAPIPFCAPVALDAGNCSGRTSKECFDTVVCPVLVSAYCVSCHLAPSGAAQYNWPNVPGARDLYSSLMAYRRFDGGSVLDLVAPRNGVFLQKGFYAMYPDSPETLAAIEWHGCLAAGGVCP